MSIPSGFKPLNDNVLIRRVEAENKTAGGIFFLNPPQEKPQLQSLKRQTVFALMKMEKKLLFLLLQGMCFVWKVLRSNSHF